MKSLVDLRKLLV